MSGGGQGTLLTSVTPGMVREIYSTGLTDGQLNAFITAAQAIFDNALGNCGYSTDLELQIVTWLTAHLACCRDPQAKSVSIGDVSKSYSGNTGMGLDATTYGQMVKLLDTCGGLVNLGKAKAFVQVGYEVLDA